MDWSKNLCSPEENVLVLGASGFVGQHVVTNLFDKREKHVSTNGCSAGKVYVLRRQVSEGGHSHGEDGPEASKLVAIEIQGDITDIDSVKRAIRSSECSVIYNLAGIYCWWRPDGEVYEKVNVDGVSNLCRAAKEVAEENTEKHIRIVHVSTVLAYGRVKLADGTVMGLTVETAFDETHSPGETTSLYAFSKQRGDDVFEKFFADAKSSDAKGLPQVSNSRLSGVLVYLACCIGADPKLVDPNADVMRISDLVYEKIPATIASDAVFTYVYVKDSAEAIVRAGEKLKIDNKTQGVKQGEITLKTSDSNGGKPNDSKVPKIFIGNQRLATQAYYSMIAELASIEFSREVSAPKYEIPPSVALGWARVTSATKSVLSIATFGWVRTPPQAAPDVVRTAVAGTLLFGCDKSERELGMVYTDIRTAFKEAVHLVVSQKR